MALQEILKLKEVVKQVLQEDRTLADNEKKLNWKVWEAIRGKRVTFVTFNAYKTLPSESSIQRVRRKLEAEYPELRGDTYYERRFVQEPEVREGINQ